MENLGFLLRKVAAEALSSAYGYWYKKIKDEYGITVEPFQGLKFEYPVLRRVYQILSKVPTQYVKDSGVTKLTIKDQGPSQAHTPNHGYYIPGTGSITLNVYNFIDPDEPEDFRDDRGYFFDRAEQTLLHEMAHAYDDALGDIAQKKEWMELSGWSKTPMPGLKRIIIQDPGQPRTVGEMFYNPSAGFPRFYGKRNSYDDFADAVAYYQGGLKSKLPDNKIKYLDDLFKKYK